MRLRVRIKNAKECRIELNFPDLSVKYNNGYAPALKVAEGDEIPLDVLDPEDIRKSLKVGSLKGYLDNQWVEEIKEDVIEIQPILNSSQFVSEQDMNKLPKIEVPPQQILPEAPVEQQKVSVAHNESITDLNKVFSYDDFCKLSHFLKLRFIKESDNVVLLNELSGKTPSTQFKNNIQLRLSQIKI